MNKITLEKMQQQIESLCGQKVQVKVSRKLDFRIKGELENHGENGFYIEVTPKTNYLLFSTVDVHYIDVESKYISTNYQKGFIEHIPLEDENEFPDIITEGV